MSLVTSASGCLRSSFDFAEGELACPQGECPPEYSCHSDGFCWRGTTPAVADARPADAPVTASDASPPCEQGALRCRQNVPERCGPSGDWIAQGTCPSSLPQCLDGLCVPGCMSGVTRCSGRDQLVCDALGVFQVARTCENACYQGQCAGVCRPGATRCDGRTIQTCSERGEWANGETCSSACVAGACSGSCVPDSTRCAPASPDVPQTCDDNGDWQSGAPCTYLCKDGLCGGSCKPATKSCDGNDVVRCNAGGVYELDEHCAQTCSAGACAGACVEATMQCTGVDVLQVCTGGSWVAQTTCANICASGACGGDCKPGAQKCEGGIPYSCAATGVWQAGAACAYVCEGQVCGGVCKPGTRRCTSDVLEECGPDGRFAPLMTCSSGCTTSGCSACQPEAMSVTCAGKCGTVQDNCGNDVACPTSCPTGSCGGGGVEHVCGCTPDAPSVTCAGKCGDVVNNCGQAVTCSAQNGGVTCSPASLCGAGDAPDNACCVPAAMATTCAGKCGMVSDNCGQSVACGDSCSSQGPSFTCGGAKPNVCGCTPTAKRCEGTTPQSCNADGVWVNGTTCDFVCTAGSCGGACDPGTLDCNGNIPRSCNTSGQWVDGVSCSSSNKTCVAGVCQGVCVQGDKRCTGTSNNTPQTCGSTGQWAGSTACSAKTCVAGVCSGVCAPGDVRCKSGSSTVLQSCDATGQYGSESTCTYFCNTTPTPDKCDGECSSGTKCVGSDVQTCQSFFWVTTTTGCPSGCNAGQCCQSDASACTGDPGATCNASVTKNCGTTVMCGATCDPGFSCGAATANKCTCTPNALRCSNNVSQKCNAGGTAWVDQPACTGGQFCVGATGACGECNPSTQQCSGNVAQTCQSNGFWASTSCYATNQWCIGGQCTGICEPGDIDCTGAETYVECLNGQFGGPAGNCTTEDPSFVCRTINNVDKCGCTSAAKRCTDDYLGAQTCNSLGYWTTTDCSATDRICCDCTNNCTTQSFCNNICI